MVQSPPTRTEILINLYRLLWQSKALALTPNPSPKLGSGVFIRGFPPNKKTTRQRGARAGGEGGVRARALASQTPHYRLAHYSWLI
jgi:hypothetical protein